MIRLLSMIRSLFARRPITTPFSSNPDTYISPQLTTIVVDMPGFYGRYHMDEYDDVYEIVTERLADYARQGIVGYYR